MPTYETPGVYRASVLPAPAQPLLTGVPLFLGLAASGPLNAPERLDSWAQFIRTFGTPLPAGHLGGAVAGFFGNGGALCHVVRLDDRGEPVQALRDGLREIENLDDIDLVCAPDVSAARPPQEVPTLPPDADRVRAMQTALLEHCDRLGNRFAILDSLPNAGPTAVIEQRRGLSGTNGALYYPWVRPFGDLSGGGVPFLPPSGHVSGVYARTDERVGVHKAPANEILRGVLDLEVELADDQQAPLNTIGINCLRAFPGRGIRIWGARTMSADTAWRYVNVRRLFLTAGRWIERNVADVAFEPNDPALWARIERELTAYFDQLHRRGALKGDTPEAAFYVKCDAQSNAELEAGKVVTEIGLAPSLPNEFVVVYVIHQPGGVTITGPVRPG